MIHESKDQMDYLIENFGNTAKFYTPEITLNEEGDRTTSVGNPKIVNILMFDASAEEAIVKIEGIDLTQTYRVYVSADEAVDKNTIIEWPTTEGEKYKIISLSKITFMDTVAYHSLIITKTKIHT